MAKPSKPISYLANETEHLLETSKELDGKDAITLFGETVKCDSYKEVLMNSQMLLKHLKIRNKYILYIDF